MKLPTRLIASVTTAALVVVLAGLTLAGQPAVRPADLLSTDANITRLTTEILGRSQFAHHPLDVELAGRLLDRYMDALDGSHSIFLQSDVDEFAAYRATLASATKTTGDTSASRVIFARYLQRLQQQTAYVADLLRTTTFDFSKHDVYSYDRQHAPRPIDLAAAQVIWRQQLRAEYLDEELGEKKPTPAQIVSTLTRRREQQLRTIKALNDDEVLEIYLDALAHVYDPHSDYLGHEQMESLSIAMNLSLFGIGASLESDDGYCKIRELIPGGPAARSGLLKAGDRIIAVAQADQAPVDIV
ncbi:MAG TPA: PDZ domain-containing protein, partial [Polyangia bacterium]